MVIYLLGNVFEGCYFRPLQVHIDADDLGAEFAAGWKVKQVMKKLLQLFTHIIQYWNNWI